MIYPTDAQLNLIRKMEKVLGIQFLGSDIEDAADFINMHKDEYSMKKYGRPWKNDPIFPTIYPSRVYKPYILNPSVQQSKPIIRKPKID